MGFEGANVIFDAWGHPLMMGLEEHLLGMFRGDAEFHENAGPSHLGVPQAAAGTIEVNLPADTTPHVEATAPSPSWSGEAERELKKIPFFVRSKARGNTERFARERGLITITVGTLYDAKAHYGR